MGSVGLLKKIDVADFQCLAVCPSQLFERATSEVVTGLLSSAAALGIDVTSTKVPRVLGRIGNDKRTEVNIPGSLIASSRPKKWQLEPYSISSPSR